MICCISEQRLYNVHFSISRITKSTMDAIPTTAKPFDAQSACPKNQPNLAGTFVEDVDFHKDAKKLFVAKQGEEPQGHAMELPILDLDSLN
ncbi:Aste57867_10552 [Aphanomyces stellatus]|uniref:Aste57867_10552 protein n=1 Tax=Aphanomyces stellatus TaxID=120398 RepID=A0A485KRB7_9STRA|nr:hypothetical protein As57867_010512 [Aphanomyces stellatus]VFT87425.1 Aste57867_10552 [Aphanomyces stellatus]